MSWAVPHVASQGRGAFTDRLRDGAWVPWPAEPQFLLVGSGHGDPCIAGECGA